MGKIAIGNAVRHLIEINNINCISIASKSCLVLNCALVLDPHPNCAGVDRDAYWIHLLLDFSDYIVVLQNISTP